MDTHGLHRLIKCIRHFEIHYYLFLIVVLALISFPFRRNSQFFRFTNLFCFQFFASLFRINIFLKFEVFRFLEKEEPPLLLRSKKLFIGKKTDNEFFKITTIHSSIESFINQTFVFSMQVIKVHSPTVP